MSDDASIQSSSAYGQPFGWTISSSSSGLFDLGVTAITYTVNLQGYYPGCGAEQCPSPYDYGVEHSFPPGTYTVAAADYWGQLRLSYFTVT